MCPYCKPKPAYRLFCHQNSIKLLKELTKDFLEVEIISFTHIAQGEPWPLFFENSEIPHFYQIKQHSWDKTLELTINGTVHTFLDHRKRNLS